MKGLIYFGCSLLISCVAVSGLNYANYRKFLIEQSKNETFVKLFNEHSKRFQKAPFEAKLTFPCKADSNRPKKATNVHELTPYDVKVIGAVGDSITAGTGIRAKTIIGLLIEDRGLSWSGGGDGNVEEYITLANMLKVYNPSLVGFATGTGDYCKENAHLNVANPGDEASNMPYQARLLVERLKSGKEGVDFQNDWKIITMFIGGNDLCSYCDDKDFYSVEKYIGYIREALDILHSEVPKAFVNLVEVLNIGVLPSLNEGLICEAIHFFGCRCGGYPENKDELQAYVRAYQKGVEDLVNSGRYDTRDDFTVVDQPFFAETHVPTLSDGSPDLSYFSPDCFHLSEKGHESAAYALWDNMIEPVGHKRRSWSPGVPVECPTSEAPYFYTKKNSPPAKQSFDKKELIQDGGNNHSNGVSGTTVAVIIIGMMCLIGVVSGLVYYSKRKRSNEENEGILKQQHSSYNQI